MNTRICLILLAAGLWTGSVFAQGPLVPPGAPGATMKTLGQVEPRTPITNVPYTISQPGSYYLVTNLTSIGHGVIITASGVTLDLMGFAISGDGVGAADFGVYVLSAQDVTVRNGTVSNFAYGIWAAISPGGRFEHLSLSSNRSVGVYLGDRCEGNTLAHCVIRDNGAAGVWFDGQNGRCDGNTLADCTIRGNGAGGVLFDSDSGQCNGNSIVDCMIHENDGVGIYLDGRFGRCDGNTLAGCTIGNSGSSHYGIYLDGSSGQCDGNTVADCAIRGNPGGGVELNGASGRCNDNRIVRCTVSGNAQYGVELDGSSGQCNGNTLADCAIDANGNYGITLSGSSGQCDGNSIADCTVRENGTMGIFLSSADGNRVERNHVSGQISDSGTPTYGIYCLTSANNWVFRNTCVGQTNNFTLGVNDTYGPVVVSAGELAVSGAPAHPWANFSR